MVIRLRIGHLVVCIPFTLRSCLCLSITTAIVGWQLAIWTRCAAFDDNDLHSIASALHT